jgi:hypothetical protein
MIRYSVSFTVLGHYPGTSLLHAAICHAGVSHAPIWGVLTMGKPKAAANWLLFLYSLGFMIYCFFKGPRSQQGEKKKERKNNKRSHCSLSLSLSLSLSQNVIY